MTPRKRTVRVQVMPAQRDALERISAERDVPVARLVRDAITTLTGVEDPIRPHRKMRAATRKGRPEGRPLTQSTPSQGAEDDRANDRS